MRFSWRAILLAPLVVPLLWSTGFTLLNPAPNPLLSFLIWFGVSSLFSLAVSILMLLPTLFLLSRIMPLRAGITAVVGAILGVVVYLPVVWLLYLESGDNSGPPQISFASYLWQYGLGEELWLFLFAGLITALVYWLLAAARPKRALVD